MGFSGISGTSDRAMSALIHYGLAEKVVKGEVRVSDLALRIIHPHSVGEKREALREAAFNPELFAELIARYPETPPSLQSLSSYLSRSNFSPAAIGPAAKAYIETCRFLQLEGAYESGAPSANEGADSGSDRKREEPGPMHVQPLAPAPPLVSPLPPAPADLELNEPNITINGRRTVRIEALLDAEGLGQLEEQIKALKMLIKPVQAASVVPAAAQPVTDIEDLI
jgi:hypothetical protein